MLLPSVRFKFDTRLLLSGFSHDFSISVDYTLTMPVDILWFCLRLLQDIAMVSRSCYLY